MYSSCWIWFDFQPETGHPFCREFPNLGMRVCDHLIRLNVAVSSLLCTGKFPIRYSVMFAAYSVVLFVFLHPSMAVNKAKAGSSISLHNHKPSVKCAIDSICNRYLNALYKKQTQTVLGRETDLAVSSLSFEEYKEIKRRRHSDAHVAWPTPLHKPDWLVFRIQTLSWLCRLSLNALCIAEPHLAANEFLKWTAFFPRLRAVISFLLISRDLMFYILRFNSVPPPCPFSFTSASPDLSLALRLLPL